jgi:hypothetical protein
MMLTLSIIQFCHANNKTSNHAMLLVQLGINSTGGSSNFGKISKHHSYDYLYLSYILIPDHFGPSCNIISKGSSVSELVSEEQRHTKIRRQSFQSLVSGV